MSFVDVDTLYTDEGIDAISNLFARFDTPITPTQIRVILDDIPKEQLNEMIDCAVYEELKRIILDDDDDDDVRDELSDVIDSDNDDDD